MKKIVLSITLVLASVILYAQVKDSTSAWHYKTDNYDCAIFPLAYMADNVTGKHFTPGFSDIDKAEHALLEQLLLQRDTTKRLPDIYRHIKKYKRQYFGYTGKDGHKLLLINLFWDDDKYIKNWLKQMIMVQGGGSSYWSIKYDLDANKLYDLQINTDE
ncbi:MAG TPA: hypothetical protein VK890_09100 [Bacteroidia bacterium]|jgi:hypothetical protein|nr:hypothetical protein [Bacteroidia bacterium]